MKGLIDYLGEICGNGVLVIDMHTNDTHIRCLEELSQIYQPKGGAHRIEIFVARD